MHGTDYSCNFALERFEYAEKSVGLLHLETRMLISCLWIHPACLAFITVTFLMVRLFSAVTDFLVNCVAHRLHFSPPLMNTLYQQILKIRRCSDLSNTNQHTYRFAGDIGNVSTLEVLRNRTLQIDIYLRTFTATGLLCTEIYSQA